MRHRRVGGALAGWLSIGAAGAQPATDERPPQQSVVTGTRTLGRDTEATVATEVIDREQIRSSGARDLAELLETRPGLVIERTPRGATLRLQGLDPEHALVLIDGDRIGGRLGGQLDLTRFSLNELERVEILRGPAAVLYGSDAMGGVINLITRVPHRPLDLAARAAYGTRRDLDLRGLAAGALERATLQLGGGYRGADAYDLDRSDEATTGSAFTRWDLGGAATWSPVDDVRLALRSHYLRNDQAAVDAVGTGAVFDRHGRSESLDSALSGSWAHVPGGRVSARAHHTLFRDQLLQDQRAGRDLDQYQASREQLFEGGVQLDQPWRAHLATAGVEGLWERLASPRLSPSLARRHRVGALVQDEWRAPAVRSVSIVAGLRVDVDSQFGASPSPRIAARWDPADGWTARASYGWGFRAPSFTEQYLLFENPSVGYVVEGNPALRPERSQGVNASLDAPLGARAAVAASVFFNDLRDLINVVTTRAASAESATRFGYENVASARTAGGELELRARLVERLWAELGYALTDARNARTGEVLEGRALHRASAQLRWRRPAWGFEGLVRAALTGRRPFRPDVDGDGQTELVWARPYLNVEARVAQRLYSGLSVYAVGRNLAGAGDPLYLPLPPRTFQLGLEARF